MTKVLVFESDNDFANQLVSGLSAYGCETQVVEDGEAGIAKAEAGTPDLILLSIELPRMNGFSVCNKLKRNSDLKKVPLVLMSSEATEETFEQHKRLRTRAEEYVKKPITVDELVARIQPLVSLEKSAEDDDLEELDEVIIEEDLADDAAEEGDVDVAFGNLLTTPEPAAAAAADDVELGDLELEEDESLKVAPQEEASAASSRPPQDETPPPADADRSELERQIAEANQKLSTLGDELRRAEEQLETEKSNKTQLESKKNAEIELMQNELDELKGKLESNQGAGTAREFLDLREQLNKKDKEILDVRDQLTSREKEVVKLNDSNIALERQKEDLQDQLKELHSNKRELEKENSALAEDKEQANKRADDYKSKSERLEQELEGRTRELKEARESHENVMATRDAQEAALREDHKQALVALGEKAEQEQKAAVEEAIARAEEQAAQEKEHALRAAAEEAEQRQSQAIASREAELKSEQDSRLAALHRANEEALRKLRAEHEQAMEEAAQASADRMAERERELEGEKNQALEAQKQELDEAYQNLVREKEAGDAEREGRIADLGAQLQARTEERDQARHVIEEREGKIAQLEAELATRAEEVRTTRQELEAESGRLARAREKWNEDSAALGRAKEALGAVLADIEAAHERAMP